MGVAAAEVNGTVIAIARDENGHVHAVNDTCTHANVSLSEGELDGCTLECWLHGSRFNMRHRRALWAARHDPCRCLPRQDRR